MSLVTKVRNELTQVSLFILLYLCLQRSDFLTEINKDSFYLHPLENAAEALRN